MTVDGAGRSAAGGETRVLHVAILAAVEEVGPDRVRVKEHRRTAPA